MNIVQYSQLKKLKEFKTASFSENSILKESLLGGLFVKCADNTYYFIEDKPFGAFIKKAFNSVIEFSEDEVTYFYTKQNKILEKYIKETEGDENEIPF